MLGNIIRNCVIAALTATLGNPVLAEDCKAAKYPMTCEASKAQVERADKQKPLPYDDYCRTHVVECYAAKRPSIEDRLENIERRLSR